MILAKFYSVTSASKNELIETFSVSSEDGIYTFSDVSFEYGKDIETQGTTGNKPISYITAYKLINSGFKIHLDHRFVDVRKKMHTWSKRAEGNGLYRMYIGSVALCTNPIVVESVKVSNLRVSGKGVWLSADLDISVQEFAGDIKNNPARMGILRKRLADFSEWLEEQGSTVSY